ncbi:MAG: response regulator [Sterolibacterium sp.]
MANELILIIDDDEWNIKLMRDLLEFKKYRILVAETGEEGVTLAVEHKPDLILMDYVLPGIDGIEAFRRIRDNTLTATIPVVAITASAMPEQARRMQEAGFDGFQTKPIDVMTFLQAVENMFSGKATQQ